MTKKLAIFLLCGLATLCNVANIYAETNNWEESSNMSADILIPREILFGNPDRIAARLSNDGQHISFLAPKDGVLNIWVAPSSNIKQAKAVTNEKQRGIRSYFWAKDNKHIIYAQDKKGDENWRLYSINIDSLKQKDLTPTDGVRASVLKLSDKFPNQILIKMNDRVPEYFDIYKVDINNGKRKLVYENKGQYASFIADDDFNIRVGYKMLPSGEGEVYLFKDSDLNKPEIFQKIASEDMLTTNPLHISRDGNKLFMVDSTDRNTSELIEIDLTNKERKTIYSDPKVDIDDYLINTKTKMIQGVATEYMRKSWYIIDKKIAADIDYLSTINDGDLEIVSRTGEDDKWLVVFLESDGPYKYYLYDRITKNAEFLFVSNSKQANMPFAKMYPIEIKARDGLTMVCYLTLPRWLDDGNGRPTKPVPLVLNVHGGPNVRDSWGV